MRAKILPTVLFAALTLTAITSVRAEEATYNYWEGGSGNSWNDKNSETGKYKWTTGELPTATETAAFKQGTQTVKIKEGKCLAAKVVFESGSVITFSRLDSGTADAVTAGEFSGEGTLKLLRTGLKAAYAGCTVSVAGFEVLHDSSFPSNYSWLDGGTAESEKMVVESAVTGSGNLACNNYVEVNGDVTLTGFLKLSANATVKNLVYDNGGCKIASDSAGGTIEKVTVKSGTLEYSSSTLKSVSAITVGKFVLDGGTLSVASDFSGTIAVAEGGGTLFLEGEWNDAASVSLPAGLSFAEGADLSKVTVQATIGESTNPAIFAIVNDNEAYSLEYVGYPFHLEELDLSWMTSGWEHPVTNKSIYSISDGSYTSLRLWNGSDWQSYSKGISVQAESHLIIKLGGNGSAFSAVVGLDRSADGDGRCGSKVVKFAVRDVVGGTNLVESAWLGTKTAAQTITADLSGIDFIDLVVYPDPNNGGSWQHCDWVNPTIVMKVNAAPVTRSADGTNHWTGMGENDYWVTAENWEFGVPGADATAVFDESVTVRIGQTGENSTTPEDVTVSNVVVNSGATLTLRPVAPEFYDGPELIVQEINGAGKIQLAKVGIKANYVGDSTECTVNVAEIEALKITRWNNDIWSWLNGGNSDGKKMVVKSKVTGNGWLSFEGNVQVDGTVYVTHKLTFGENVNKPTYCFTSEAFSFADKGNEEASKNKGSFNCIYIKGGVFTPSAYEGLFTSYVLDGGTLNVADVASSVSVLSGGFLRWTVGEAFGDSVPDWPAGLALSFVDGASATLADVYAVVTDATGAQRTYSISESGGVYSLGAAQPSGDKVVWIGGGSDNKWENGANWQFGAVPTADQTAVFEANADVVVNIDIVGGVQIADGATVTLRSSNAWANPKRFLTLSSAAGEGRLALSNVQLIGNNEASATVIDVAELEILREIRWGAEGYSDYPASMLASRDGKTICVKSPIIGGGDLECYMSCDFAGDNSRFTGTVTFNTEHNSSWSSRLGDEFRFCVPQAGFRGAAKCAINGRFHIAFTEGTIGFGNVSWKESWGTGIYMPYGTTAVTIEVSGGEIYNSYQGSGFGVFTRAEGSDGVDGATDGCAGLTIKKVGEGTLVYGLTKAHNLIVAEGRVEFTGENNAGDDADVNVTVKAGASIGTPEAFSHENPNWTLGGDVTVRHQFTFEPGAAIKQEYIATTTTDEQTQDETTTYSMRKLTIADDVDLANVVFGVTNPEDLPAVTKAAVAGLPRFTMFAANSLSGVVATENDGYAPDGSEKNCKWLFRTKRNSVNEVEFYPFQKPGFAIIVR